MICLLDDLIDIKEMMKILHISKNVAYEMTRQTDFPAILVGRQIRVSKSELEKYLIEKSKEKWRFARHFS